MVHTSAVLRQYVWIQKEVITVLVTLVMKEMDITVPVRIYYYAKNAEHNMKDILKFANC